MIGKRGFPLSPTPSPLYGGKGETLAGSPSLKKEINIVNSIELKRKWQRGEVSPGLWMRLTDPTVYEMINPIGLDWVLLDAEHSAYDMQTLQTLFIALRDSPSVPLIRVPGNDPIFIKRVLDIGAGCVLVPHVRTEEEVRMAVAACKYAPVGIRCTGTRRPGRYSG